MNEHILCDDGKHGNFLWEMETKLSKQFIKIIWLFV